MSQSAKRVLFIADQFEPVRRAEGSFDHKHCLLDVVGNSTDALALLKQQPYDLIALDASLPFYIGLQIRQLLDDRGFDLVSVVTAAQQNQHKPDQTSAKEHSNGAHGVSDHQASDCLELQPIQQGQAFKLRSLEQEREQALEELRQHNRNLTLLNRVAQLLTSTLDIREVIDQLVRTITDVIEIEGSSVWLLDEKRPGYLLCAAIFSQGQNITPEHLSLPPGKGIASWVVEHDQLANVADVATDTRFSSSIDQSTGFNTHSLLAIPLRTPHKVVGVLELVNRRGGQFQENDIVLTETLAASAAIAIENARLMQTLRQNRDELQARNEELDAYAHTVAHDLKNPLTMIIGFADLLRDNYDSLPPDNLKLCLNAIVDHGMKMSSIIDTLLKLAGVRGAEQVKLDKVDMGTVIAETLKRLDLMLTEHQAVITEPETWPAAQGYGPWLEEVWYNYLSNGLKYGGTPPRLELGYDRQNDMIRFWVKDNGPGMQIDNPELLFTPLQGGTGGERKRNSHGLGLSIVQRIIRRLGGTVGAESKLGHGSKFYFTLPAAVTKSQ